MIAIISGTTEVDNEIILNDNIEVSNISYDDSLSRYDFDYLHEAVSNIETKNLEPDEYYQFTFKRKYEDDGSGQMVFDWFELIETIKVTQN